MKKIPQMPCPIVNTELIFNSLWNHELEHKRKQENGHLALLGNHIFLLKSLLHLCYMKGRIC